MAIFHLNVKTISRRRGSSAVCAAAYRAGEKLYDERRRRTYNFERRGDISHSAILVPGGGEVSTRLRAQLWNAVEAHERGPDACVALEAVFALPRELDKEASARLARHFVEEAFVRRGMVTDLNVHAAELGGRADQPHAHALLSTRRLESVDQDALALGERGALCLGPKLAPWRRRDQLLQWRETLADSVNAALAEHRVDRRVDHRTYRAQGVGLEPQNKIGPAGARRARRGEPAERAEDHQDISARNGDRIIDNPAIALTALTHRQSTFTDADLKDFLRRQTDDPGQFELALAGARTSNALVRLGRNREGVALFTSRDLLSVETQLEAIGLRLRGSNTNALEESPPPPSRREAAAQILADLLGPSPLTIVAGASPEERDAVIRSAAEGWSAERRPALALAATSQRVRGLGERTGLAAETLSHFERTLESRFTLPGRPQILILDHAGLFASRSLERVARAAEADGMKLVLTAETEDLEPGETAGGFRALAGRAHDVRLLDGGLRRVPSLGGDGRRGDGERGQMDVEAAARFAARRGLLGARDLSRNGRAAEPDMLKREAGGKSGLARSLSQGPREPTDDALSSLRARWAHRTVRVMAKAVVDADTAGGALALSQRSRLLARAAGRMEALWPGSAPALAEAVALSPELLLGAASGRTAPVLMAMREVSVQRGHAPPSWMRDMDLGLGLGRGRD